jgi:hypothetical protein
MWRIVFVLLIALTAVFIPSSQRCFVLKGGDSEPTVDNKYSNPQVSSAAEIIRRIVEDERNIDGVHSLLLRMEGTATRVPEGIAAETARLKKRFPATEITAEKFPNLRPEMTQEMEIAFDAKRIRFLRNWHDVRYSLEIWGGIRSTIIIRRIKNIMRLQTSC